jgi:hypothetical protein
MGEIKRRLATIRTIKAVEPIEGADSIVKVTFEGMGWVVVTNKNTNPQVGQRRCYFEVDSVLPKSFNFAGFDTPLPLFDFMAPYNYRVKTIKLRGQVSQGLSIPLNEIEEAYRMTLTDVSDGEDLTDTLGIVKYELPESTQISGDVKGPFPSFISKTDEERCISAGTLITTEKGALPIEALCSEASLGTLVHSVNEATGLIELKPLIGFSVLPPHAEEWFKITTESGATLLVTGNHRVYLPALNCYRRTDEISLGDELLLIG